MWAAISTLATGIGLWLTAKAKQIAGIEVPIGKVQSDTVDAVTRSTEDTLSKLPKQPG